MIPSVNVTNFSTTCYLTNKVLNLRNVPFKKFDLYSSSQISIYQSQSLFFSKVSKIFSGSHSSLLTQLIYLQSSSLELASRRITILVDKAIMEQRSFSSASNERRIFGDLQLRPPVAAAARRQSQLLLARNYYSTVWALQGDATQVTLFSSTLCSLDPR